MRTPSSAPGMTIAPSLLAAPHDGARYLTSHVSLSEPTSLRRDRQVERGLEPSAGFDDGRGAAPERVDLGGHGFDRDELARRGGTNSCANGYVGIELQRERAPVAPEPAEIENVRSAPSA